MARLHDRHVGHKFQEHFKFKCANHCTTATLLYIACAQVYPLFSSCVPHLCAMAASFLVFFQMQQIAMDTVVIMISATIKTIVATSRPITVVIVSSGVLTGTETWGGGGIDYSSGSGYERMFRTMH